MKKNCNVPAATDFRSGRRRSVTKDAGAREFAHCERGRYDSLGEDNFIRNHTGASIPLSFALYPLPPPPRRLSARIPHKPSRRVRRPDDDIFTVGGEGREIRAQLPSEEPCRTEYTSNKPLTTPPRKDLRSPTRRRRRGPLWGWIGNVDQTADTPLAPLSTNSPAETLARSTVYAFLTRHSF